ncbi:aldo/keto reductase [Aestuariivirga sp.]|uniref:aldo/keto reductase n=1 Tax=Aestuariivirga sp. TaxID=2650926 RepID=UPI0039E5EAC8
MTQNLQKMTKLARADLSIPPLCLGMTALADMPDTYGYGVDEARAMRTLEAVFNGPIAFIDTSRNYGLGRSEERIGKAIKARGGLPKGFLISSKLDRNMDTLNFDGARARQSVEESLKALGVSQIDLLHLHDPEYASDLKDVTGKGGAAEELFKMKEEGLCKAVGLAAGRTDIMMPMMRDFHFDAIITHNRYTLLNRHALPMLELAKSRDITVLNAAPYASGILAKGAAKAPLFAYMPAGDDIKSKANAIEALCAKHGVAMGAAALQFSMRSPYVASTICGVSSPERVQQTIDWANQVIPDALWKELEALPFDMDDPEANRIYKPA